MAKLTKDEIKKHQAACELLKQDQLTIDERFFVLENWHEGAEHLNSSAGAFFTPASLARDFAVETFAGRTIDLCAGIGTLSFLTWVMNGFRGEFTCVELNAAYADVGRKIMPEATWIVADVLSPEILDLDHFDLAIGNPPFGKLNGSARAPRYSGSDFELKVIDVAGLLADQGTFIVPQNSAPFRFSGRDGYERVESDRLAKFYDETGIVLQPNCGIDTTVSGPFRGTNIRTEIVVTDFRSPEPSYIPRGAKHFAEPMLAF